MISPCTPSGGEMGGLCALDATSEGAPQHALLKEILSRPELQASQSPDMNGWLTELLRKLFPGFVNALGSEGAQIFAAWTRIAVFVIAAALALWVLWRMRKARWQRSGKAAPRTTPQALGGVVPSAEDPLKSARHWLPANPRRALRETLVGLLQFLESSGWFRRDPSKTNREIAVELRRSPAPPSFVEACGVLLRDYDDRYYSLKPVEVEDAQRFLQGVQRLVSLSSEKS